MTASNTYQPALSIVSPFYNVEAYLDRFLAMIRLQTLEDIEIILVDDGSTDGSRAIADSHAAQDSRIRVIENECNVGLGVSRDIGTSQARGAYLAFPDTDDWVDADFYEHLYRTAQANSFPDIVRGSCVLGEGEPTHNPNDPINKFIEQGLAAGRPLYLLFTGQHWTAIFRRKLFKEKEVCFGSARSAEDNVFLLRAGYAASTFAPSYSNARYHYCIRPGSISTTYNSTRYHSEMDALTEEVDFLLGHIEPCQDRTSYLIIQTEMFLKKIAHINEADSAYEHAYPQRFAEQLRRIPDIDAAVAQSHLIERVLSDTPRSFEPPPQPFFSIVVPIRNMADTVIRALKSILVQAFESYEIIVVANGCNDNTVDVVKEQAIHYPQIRLIELPDAGVANARNIGIDAARGRYVVFLDADDFYLSGALKTMAHALEECPCDMLFTLRGKSNQIPAKTSVYKSNPAILRALIDEQPVDDLPDVLSHLQMRLELFGQWGKAYRTAFLQDNNLKCDKRLVAVEDRHFNSLACAKAKTVSVLDAQVYYYASEKHYDHPKTIKDLEAIAACIAVFLHEWRDMGLSSKQVSLAYATGALRIMDVMICRSNNERRLTEWYQHYLQGDDAKTILHAVKAGRVPSRYREEFERSRPLLADSLARLED